MGRWRRVATARCGHLRWREARGRCGVRLSPGLYRRFFQPACSPQWVSLPAVPWMLPPAAPVLRVFVALPPALSATHPQTERPVPLLGCGACSSSSYATSSSFQSYKMLLLLFFFLLQSADLRLHSLILRLGYALLRFTNCSCPNGSFFFRLGSLVSCLFGIC